MSSDNGGIVSVKYTLPEDCNTAAVSVRGLTDGNVKSVECSPFENEVSIDMQGESKGIYIIELLNEGITVDTQKIILK